MRALVGEPTQGSRFYNCPEARQDFPRTRVSCFLSLCLCLHQFLGDTWSSVRGACGAFGLTPPVPAAAARDGPAGRLQPGPKRKRNARRIAEWGPRAPPIPCRPPRPRPPTRPGPLLLTPRTQPSPRRPVAASPDGAPSSATHLPSGVSRMHPDGDQPPSYGWGGQFIYSFVRPSVRPSNHPTIQRVHNVPS